MKIVTVVPLKKGISLTDLTYFTSKDIPPGSIVTIPLRNKKILGLVISIEDVTDAKKNIKDMDFNLKKILEIKDHSIFSKEYLASILEASTYFVSSKNNAVTSLIPALFRERYDQIAEFSTKKLKEKQTITPHKDIKKNIRAEKLLLQNPLEDRLSTYKTIIRGSFADKKSVFLVLPTEHDLDIFYKSLSRGIEKFTFVVHSRLTTKKTLQAFENIYVSEHPLLILGTAPFLSIPRKDIGTIIIEHESSSSYKMINRPHFDLRIFVELFASKINARLILGDTMLRFETIARREIDGLIPMYPLSLRVDFPGEIEIVGRENKKFQVLSDESISEIKKAIQNKKNIFIFSLRKGLATMTICKDCNETLSCEKCLAPVVLYLSGNSKNRIFSCNKCKREVSPEIKCKNCGSWNLMPLGIGTDTVWEYVTLLLQKEKIKAKVFKLDKESAKNSKGAEKIVKEFEENEGSVLIGTEMAFSYLKKKIPISIIASFDSLWSIPNYKMSEKILHIINSILSISEKKFIIQTKNEKDKTLLAVKNSNLLSFIREELEDRKTLGYPPYKRFIKIMHLGDKEKAIQARKIIAELFAEYSPEIFSGFVSKISGKYATNALIKIDTSLWSLPEISSDSVISENLSLKLQSLPSSFQVLVDPDDLL